MRIVKFAPRVIKSIQRGESTIDDAGCDCTTPITAVDLSKSFLIFSSRGGTGAADIKVNGYLSSTTEICFCRTGSAGEVKVRWEVVEYV